MTATAPIVDQDATRPGVQLLVDLWHVHTSEGSMLVAAGTPEIAERFAVHSLVQAGKPAPRLHTTELASERVVASFLEAISDLLNIRPGDPIPGDRLEEAHKKVPPLRLSTYRLLTERAPGEASTVTVIAPAPESRRWAHVRLDWIGRIAGSVGFLVVWVAGWIAPLWLRIVLPWERWVLHAANIREAGGPLGFEDPADLWHTADAVDLNSVGWITFSVGLFLFGLMVWMAVYYWLTEPALNAALNVDPHSPPPPRSMHDVRDTRAGRK